MIGLAGELISTVPQDKISEKNIVSGSTRTPGTMFGVFDHGVSLKTSLPEKKMHDLNGKVAFVSGGAKGIGEAVVRRFSADGASVILADIDREAGEQLAKELSPRVRFVFCDVSQETDLQNALDFTLNTFGRLDILVNDAAWQLNKSLLETSTEEFKRVMDINVTGTFILMREAAKIMIARKIQGVFVNFSSTFAVVGSPGYLAYHASKGAVDSMTRAAAIALLPYGIRVNAVAPGTTDTPGLHDGARDTGNESEGLKSFLTLQPMKRFGKPEEIASVVRFLVDGDASFLRGATILADGGYTIV